MYSNWNGHYYKPEIFYYEALDDIEADFNAKIDHNIPTIL